MAADDRRQPRPLFRQTDRDKLVELATKAAAAHDGVVSVYSEDGTLARIINFSGGVASEEPRQAA